MIERAALCLLVICITVGVGAVDAQGVSKLSKPLEPNIPSPYKPMADIARQVPGFGGFYLDSSHNRLYVYLLEPRTKTRASLAIAAMRGAESFPHEIHVLQGQYDYRELIEWNKQAVDVLALPGVSSKGIDDAKNRLLIGLEREEARGPVQQALDQLDIPREAVNIEVTGSVKFLSHTVRNRVRPVVGGLQIYQPGSDKLCTLGFNAIRDANGAEGFVTASHCTAVRAGGADGFYIHQQGTSLNDRLGAETIDPPYFDDSFAPSCPDGRVCRFSDAAFIKYENDAERVQGRLASVPLNSIAINHGLSLRITKPGVTVFDPVGTPLQKIGRVTGRTAGTLDKTCIDVNVANSNLTLLCQYGVAGADVAPGDSGAPVFEVTNDPAVGDVSLHGLLWGANSPDSYWFSSFGNIQSVPELGGLFVCPPALSCYPL